MNALVLTVYKRPAYTREVVRSLAACFGAGEHVLYVSHDCAEEHLDACKEVADICHEYAGAFGGFVYDAHPRLGIDLNKLYILRKVFADHPFAVFVEDDTPVARDALRYFQWVQSEFEGDPNFVSATGYNRYLDESTHCMVAERQRYLVDRGGQFTPWVWGMFASTYERLIGDGEAYKAKWGAEANGRFDHHLCDLMRADPALYSVYPVCPRSNHTGWEGSEHTESQTWLVEHEYAPFGAWQLDLKDVGLDVWQKKWVD